MDDEVRKAMRVLERAGLDVILVNHDLIIKAALDFIRADTSLALHYVPDTHQTRSLLTFLIDGNKDAVIDENHTLTQGVRYYLGLAKFIYAEGKATLG